MSFALIYLAMLLLPGFLIAQLLKIRTQLFLYSVSFSLFYFTITLAFSFFLKISVNNFILIYCVGLFILIIAFLKIEKQPVIFRYQKVIGYFILAILIGIYLSYAGFYNEVPSDLYIHLEFFKRVSTQIKGNEFPSLAGLSIFSKSAQYWYYLPTLISNLIGQDFLRIVEVYAAINIAIILFGIYGFAQWLFKSDTTSQIELTTVGLLSVFFFVTHFGINVFSYIRYYSIAPTILSYAIYLTAVVSLFKYFYSEINLARLLLITIALTFTTYVLHKQEAMFIGTIYAVASLVIILQNSFPRFILNRHNKTIELPNSLIPFSIFAVLVLSLIYFYTINSLPLTKIVPPKIISIGGLLGLDAGYFILNPFIQFYTVVTHWGLWVIVLYIVFYRQLFAKQPFILAAMLVPLVTVFNPLFTNFFLRIASWDVLWRFLYMLPLYLVAARLVTAMLFISKPNAFRRSFGAILILLTFVLLLPIKFSSMDFPFSRVNSLTRVHDQATPLHWQDMLDYLSTLPNKELIITDPVTGYMISALTIHDNRRYKFYMRRIYDPYIFDDYSIHPLQKYSGSLLTINRRKGISTKVAKISGHWHPDTLKLTEYYPEKLIDHIELHPQHFQLQWQADDIKIYRITY